MSNRPNNQHDPMTQTLKNRRALITGGSRGIGAAIVKRLAREGADVAFTYSSSPDKANETAKAAQALGVQAIAIQADSADASAVVAAVRRTVKELGGIDILVNSAGVLALGRIDDFKLADFDRTVAVNVRAVFVATQAAVKHMKEGGRIINIGSCNAERMPFQGGPLHQAPVTLDQGLKGRLRPAFGEVLQQPDVIALSHLHRYWPPKAKTETIVFQEPKKALHKAGGEGTAKWFSSIPLFDGLA
jgi:NAD(P)-dependent dehydrogenase (short-subunit alcohol dehydrogenase family)